MAGRSSSKGPRTGENNSRSFGMNGKYQRPPEGVKSARPWRAKHTDEGLGDTKGRARPESLHGRNRWMKGQTGQGRVATEKKLKNPKGNTSKGIPKRAECESTHPTDSNIKEFNDDNRMGSWPFMNQFRDGNNAFNLREAMNILGLLVEASSRWGMKGGEQIAVQTMLATCEAIQTKIKKRADMKSIPTDDEVRKTTSKDDHGGGWTDVNVMKCRQLRAAMNFLEEKENTRRGRKGYNS